MINAQQGIKSYIYMNFFLKMSKNIKSTTRDI